MNDTRYVGKYSRAVFGWPAVQQQQRSAAQWY
jgi:hypothetical protein